MAPNPSNSSNLEQLALKGLIIHAAGGRLLALYKMSSSFLGKRPGWPTRNGEIIGHLSPRRGIILQSAANTAASRVVHDASFSTSAAFHEAL